MTYTAEYASPLGTITLASDGSSLTGLWLEGQKHFGSSLQKPYCTDHLPLFDATAAWLDCYFSGSQPSPDAIPLAPQGSSFRQLIWNLLLEIPYGTVVTYGELASQAAFLMGKASMSAQAVGNAVSRNPISLLIPCHRVIGADGSLTGYAGGIKRKLFLLQLENALTNSPAAR